MTLSGSCALLWLASVAAAPAPKAACIQASELGQDARDQGKPLAARQQFLACAITTCPEVVRRQCQRWLTEVEARIPTLLLRVRDPRGQDVVDAQVTVDGRPVPEALSGRAVAVDPGLHVFRLVRPSGEGITVHVLAREGEKDRLVDAVFPDPVLAPEPHQVGALSAPLPPPAGAESPSQSPQPAPAVPPLTSTGASPFPWLPAGLTAAAVAGGAGFVGFGLTARADVERLRTTCAPACSAAELSTVKTHEAIANVSLGVAGVAGGLAVWRWLAHAPDAGRVELGAAPFAGGVGGAVQGRF